MGCGCKNNNQPQPQPQAQQPTTTQLVKEQQNESVKAVSYTHLTLLTILRV